MPPCPCRRLPRRWPRLLSTFLLTVTVAGCGNLPRPFLHDGAEAPLVSPQPLQPVGVLPVVGQPGLAEAVVAALAKEDIAATAQPPGRRFLQLSLSPDAAAAGLTWRLAQSDGKLLGEQRLRLPTPAAGDDGQNALAAATAAAVAQLLRGDDLGGRDLAARPKLAVDQVTVTGALDAALLKSALIEALQQQGMAVVEVGAAVHVRGSLRITAGLAGHDLVEVTWVVTDDKGNEIGKVNQGSPVRRDELLSHAMQTTHQIAAGGADGIKQLVQTQR